jgi:hypothetical protein
MARPRQKVWVDLRVLEQAPWPKLSGFVLLKKGTDLAPQDFAPPYPIDSAKVCNGEVGHLGESFHSALESVFEANF